MMAHKDMILVDALPSYCRVALIRDGVLDQIWIDDADRGAFQSGAMVAVKISQAFSQHNRAMIDLGDVKGSLRIPDKHSFKIGEVIPAVITSAARDDGFGTKPLQLKLAGHIKPDSGWRHGDVITPAPTGVEHAAAHAGDADVLQDDDGKLWAEYEVEEALEAALNPYLDLPKGGRIAISTPPGAAVIDGDSGASQLPPMALAEDMVPEVMRQLRLRRIGGPIVIDFPRLSPDEMKTIHKAMQGEAKKDSLKPSLHGFTRGGLYTMARPWRDRLLKEEILPAPRALGLMVLRRVRRHLALVGTGKASGGLKLGLHQDGIDWLHGEGAEDLRKMMAPASFQVDFTAFNDINGVIDNH